MGEGRGDWLMRGEVATGSLAGFDFNQIRPRLPAPGRRVLRTRPVRRGLIWPGVQTADRPLPCGVPPSGNGPKNSPLESFQIGPGEVVRNEWAPYVSL